MQFLKQVSFGTSEIAGVLTAGLISQGCSPDQYASDPQHNIIFFLVDDMGWQDTSVPFWKERTHFNDLYYTPNMERLAAEGMKFTQAYAYAVCSPTRTSLMMSDNLFFIYLCVILKMSSIFV